VTTQEDGCWYVSDTSPESPIHHPAFPVKVVDAPLAADVFHGAYAAGLVLGMTLSERVSGFQRLAVESGSCWRTGRIPNLDTVQAFFKRRMFS
jgi:sugar/nucleoside kinase (ribokinase family)